MLDARRWSLTARMTSFFGAAIAVIVVCVSAMMYAELVHQLRANEETELHEQIALQQKVWHGPGSKDARARLELALREQQDESQEFAWQLLGADGRPVTASGNAGRLSGGAAPPPAPGRHMRVDAGGARMLLFDVAASGPDGDKVLRGMLDVSQDEQVLKRYRDKLASVVVLAILASVGIGYLLARRGLAPLRAMSVQIGRVNARRLHARIAQDAWPAELRTLAETFNELMARIEQSFEQLSRFSSDLAHEFRSPINTLVAAASVTLGRARSPEEYQNTLAVVVEEGERLSRMVSSMLFLARADNAKQLVQLEDLSTRSEFAKLLEFFEIVAEEQGVTLETAGDARLHADPLLLRQALSNLLANALRYSARGGTVRLFAQDLGAEVLIAVADNGAGIAPLHLPFLFDRFYRADPARSAADSTGLGLAVVRSIAELHGGSVAVRSTLGEGSTFELRLPKDPGAAGAVEPPR